MNLGWAAAAAKSLQSVSDSVRPHRRQPTRLPRPWDSPGKNTGVGCHTPNEKKEEPQRDGQEEQTSVCVLSAKLCWTRCDPMDCRPPGSSVHGILQARIREWVAISSSGAYSPRQRSNLCFLCLLRWQVDYLLPSHLGSLLNERSELGVKHT